MNNRDVLERMRDDWNARAREDAHYFVAFGRRDQDEVEFQETAADVVRSLERELRRLSASQRGSALEIGCGPGRLMLPLSRYFAEIHGIDVSDEMIRRAVERLAGLPHAHAHATSGSDLARFANDSFDFVYSYAVFQHIPSRDVVMSYLRESWRVLKPGGYLRCQINGLPEPVAQASRPANPGVAQPSGPANPAAPLPGSQSPAPQPAGAPRVFEYNTWSGVRIGAAEVAAFAREQGFQLLALEGEGTQYMWTTLRKRCEGRGARGEVRGAREAIVEGTRGEVRGPREAVVGPSHLAPRAPNPAPGPSHLAPRASNPAPGPSHLAPRTSNLPAPPARVCRVTNAYSSEPAVPARGRFACVSLWLENLPGDCDLNDLAAAIGGRPAKPFYIGPPEADGLQQLNIALPQPSATGLLPVEVRWLGNPLIERIWLRVVPPGPAVPRLVSVSDGVDLLSTRIVSRTVKVILEEVDEPEKLRARIDDQPVSAIEYLCTDPLPPRIEVNLPLPVAVGAGPHAVFVEIGSRRLAPIPIEVA